MLFDTLALLSLIVVIMLLGRLVNIFPSLVACIIRGKENINLALSVKLSRDRNALAAAMVIPFCLSTYRFQLFSPAFMSRMNDNVALGVTIGIFLSYMLIRVLSRHAFRPRKTKKAAYDIAASAAYTFFIILTLLLMTVGGIMAFFDVNPDHIKTAMIWISGTIYLIFLLRKIQIFASSYNFIAVFLYLCALEIIPTGVLVTSAIIF